jgi:hypothetical protein
MPHREEMAEIPDVWRAFFERLAPSPPSVPRGTRITQHGELLLDSRRWVPFSAEQEFEATRCAFSWRARVTMAPLFVAKVVDAYEDGRGRLEARMLGIRFARGEPGPELDRGELVRYLAELPWNPMAIVHNPELRFTTAPDGSPRVWSRSEASYVDCTFDDAGDLVEVRTESRHRSGVGSVPWSARFSAHGELGGLRVPTAGETSWDSTEGREVVWRGTIDTLEWR